LLFSLLIKLYIIKIQKWISEGKCDKHIYRISMLPTHLILLIDHSRVREGKCKAGFDKFLLNLSIYKERNYVHCEEK
jgi:hypothetical protein